MIGDAIRGVVNPISSLLVLSDSTVVSGDGKGHVQFWDGDMGVLTSTCHQHVAEIYALEKSVDENHVFASGADSRITCLQRVSATNAPLTDAEARDPLNMQWVYTTAVRPHTRDVFALAICNGQATVASTTAEESSGEYLLSGGMDCKLCVTSVDRCGFSTSRPGIYLPTPASGLAAVCIEREGIAHGLALVRHRHHLDLWSFAGQESSRCSSTGGGQATAESASTCALSVRIQLKGDCHLACASLARLAVGSGGDTDPLLYLAVCSSGDGTRLWLIRSPSPTAVSTDTPGKVGIERVALPVPVGFAIATSCALSTDGHRLVLSATSGQVFLVDIGVKEGEGPEVGQRLGQRQGHRVVVTLRHTFDHRDLTMTDAQGEEDGGLRGVGNRVALSSDGMWLAIADASAEGRVYVYDLDR